jgi:NitT/TauT family transport system substrate-binding protein
MTRREVLGRTTWAAAAMAGGCRRKPVELRKIQVALVPRFTLAPFYLADELGYFTAKGLQIEVVPVPQAQQLLPLLAGGKVDVGFTGITPGLVNAVLRGAQLQIVAARDRAVRGCSTGGVIYGSAKAFPNGLSDLHALKGKRLTINSPIGLMGFFLDTILATAGMTQADLEVIRLQAADGAAAVVSGRVDAIIAASLDKDLDLATTKVVRGVSMADLLPDFQYTFILFGKSMLQADRETGVDFLEAYLRGLRDFQAGKDPKAFQELAAAGHSELAAARSACRASLSTDGRVEVANVKQVVDWAIAKGHCEKSPDMAQFVDNERVAEAYRRLERGGKS